MKNNRTAKIIGAAIWCSILGALTGVILVAIPGAFHGGGEGIARALHDAEKFEGLYRLGYSIIASLKGAIFGAVTGGFKGVAQSFPGTITILFAIIGSIVGACFEYRNRDPKKSFWPSR